MDEEYQYNPEDFGSYGMSYDPNSSFSQAGFAPTPQYDQSQVDFSNLPSFDSMPSYQESSGGQSVFDTSSLGDMWGTGNNYGFSPDPALSTSQFMPEQYGQSTLFNPQAQQESAGTDWAGMLKGGTDFLGKLFSSGTGGYGGSGGSTNTFLKGLAGLLAAQQEKKSNQQMYQQIPQTVNSVRQFAAPYDVSSTGAGMMTPGATTMRDAAQQQAALANQRLQNFRNNPNSDAGYKATNDQIEQVLNRQAAMHGNRNNFNATAPAMLAAKAAAQLKYDQNYQQDLNNWDTRSGANISPVQASGLEALMRGQQYGAQGNSPYYDALGKILNTNSYENNPQIQELLQAIKGR